MLFICYPKCTTCQKARAYLDGSGISYDLRDIKENNPSYDELREWFAASRLPVKKLFNTSGLQYKALGLKGKLPGMSDDECLRLLATDGMLVKRPILAGYGAVLFGFRQAEWETALIPAKEAAALREKESEYVQWARGRYITVAGYLESGSNLLTDLSAFRKNHGKSVEFGYNRCLDSAQIRAQITAEKFLASFNNCQCDNKVKARGLTGDERRIAESKWMAAAAAEIRRVAGSENDYGFWRERALW